MAGLKNLSILLLLFFATSGYAQIGSDVSRIADWVEREGGAITLDEAITREMGLGVGVVPAKVKAFRLNFEGITYALAVARIQGNRAVVILRRTPTLVLQWQVSDAGEPLALVNATTGAIRLQNSHAHDDLLKQAVDYLVTQVR